MNFLESPLVRDFLNGDLPTVEVAVSIPPKTLVEIALAALVVGACLIMLTHSL